MFLRCITQDMAAILNSEVIDYLPKDVYLAGGTAAGLYFGHRLSVDFDFFTPEEFNSLDLSTIISEKLKSSFSVTKSRITENTLVMNLNETGFSLFTYQYPLLDDTITMENISVPVASQLDLSLMKLVAINQRGSCLKKSLVYFDDAEKDLNVYMYSETKKFFEILQEQDWEEIKIFFEKFAMANGL